MEFAYNVFQSACPSREAFDQVFSRWGILVLAKLGQAPEGLGFAVLHRAIDGISERLLSRTLKDLEAQGLVARGQGQGGLNRVSYALTAQGRPVALGVLGLIDTFYKSLPQA